LCTRKGTALIPAAKEYYLFISCKLRFQQKTKEQRSLQDLHATIALLQKIRAFVAIFSGWIKTNAVGENTNSGGKKGNGR